ncbi:hypothetical protein O181_091920 [Austropuccinia psidii MF-1]|uniref:Uncharacterized protein n=1 Tax=Austropuccinia psidii MF-1 TaxID=1389203 RepID=A0A9Q3IYP6_9BASI|nr:hypothetical protein [Austropuccinia psidii MF-1]
MSSKLTELTQSSPSVPLPSVLCGSGIFSWLGPPWSMTSLGHFDPSQTYDGYKAVEFLVPACTDCLKKVRKCFQHYNPRSSNFHHCFVWKKPCQRPGAPLSGVMWYLWSKKYGPFGKEFPAPEDPTPDVTGSRKRGVARWTNVGGRSIYSSS